MGPHSHTSCATRLGALSASASVRNVWPDHEQSLTLGESSGFALSGMYPLDNILLTSDLMLLRHDINTPLEREVGLSSHQRGQCTNPGYSSPRAQQSPDEPGTRKSRGTSPHAHVKLEPEEDSFLLGGQKPEPLEVFDFLKPFRRLSDVKMNTSRPCMVQMTKS